MAACRGAHGEMDPTCVTRHPEGRGPHPGRRRDPHDGPREASRKGHRHRRRTDPRGRHERAGGAVGGEEDRGRRARREGRRPRVHRRPRALNGECGAGRERQPWSVRVHRVRGGRDPRAGGDREGGRVGDCGRLGRVPVAGAAVPHRQGPRPRVSGDADRGRPRGPPHGRGELRGARATPDPSRHAGVRYGPCRPRHGRPEGGRAKADVGPRVAHPGAARGELPAGLASRALPRHHERPRHRRGGRDPRVPDCAEARPALVAGVPFGPRSVAAAPRRGGPLARVRGRMASARGGQGVR